MSLREAVNLSSQALFDKVATHLLIQNKQSLHLSEDACAYRSGTLTCAIGCLLSDDEYNSAFEGLNIEGVLERLRIDVPDETLDLLADLQGVHDYFDPVDWPERLRIVAKKHELGYD